MFPPAGDTWFGSRVEGPAVVKGKEEVMLNNNESTVGAFVRKVLGQRTRSWLTIASCACITFVAGSASAQTQLAPNQTHGFGNGRLITFTYLQNFDCVSQPTFDLDFNGTMAQSDPNEMQTPICQ